MRGQAAERSASIEETVGGANLLTTATTIENAIMRKVKLIVSETYQGYRKMEPLRYSTAMTSLTVLHRRREAVKTLHGHMILTEILLQDNVSGFAGKIGNVISIFGGEVEDEFLNLMGR